MKKFATIALAAAALAMVAGVATAQDMKQVERLRPKIAMVFQQFNLWSHMTVLQNGIEAPIHVLKLAKAEAVERAEAVLNRVGMYDRKDFDRAQI